MSTNYDKYAVGFLENINNCIDTKTQDFVKIKSAIVDSVNKDGTVNIHFPLDDQIWSNVSNQSIYQDIEAGDEVKIIEQNGVYKNCWIIGVHKAKDKTNINNKLTQTQTNMSKDMQSLNKEITGLKNTTSLLTKNFFSVIKDNSTTDIPTLDANLYPHYFCLLTQTTSNNGTTTITEYLYFSKQQNNTNDFAQYTWVKIC